MNLEEIHNGHKLYLKNKILECVGINIDSIDNKAGFFKNEFYRIFNNYTGFQYKDRYIYFIYFLQQLKKIKRYNNKDFDDYLTKLSVDGENLKGERFEILTYTRLIDNSIPFIKPKGNPDFEINIDQDKVYIECAIRQSNKKGWFAESIEGKIKEKQSKGYANIETALHIEISQTRYNSITEDESLDNDVLKKLIDEKIKEVDFGAIVLISTGYNQIGKVVGYPIFSYKENCSNGLRILHERMFSLKSEKTALTIKNFY